MSFPLTYQDAMNRLAKLSEPSQPAYVQLQALTTLVRELSPANARRHDASPTLQPNPNPALPELPLTEAQQRDFHLHPLAADLPATDAPLTDDDDDGAEEEDDPF